ncbi:MAG: hypothetical protein FWH07_07870 [Oscillospiraceae bacterium]|nr:hypothetical protein [Oscillospiraceae bacterium]
MDNKNTNGGKFLHGNSARIEPKKKMTPLFEMSATNGYHGDYKGAGIYGTSGFSRAYNRLDFPDFDNFDEELGIREVDSNPLS